MTKEEEAAYEKERLIINLLIEGIRSSNKVEHQKTAVREKLKNIAPPEIIEGLIARFLDQTAQLEKKKT